MNGIGVVEIRPVLLKGIAVAGDDVVRLDTAHDQIHTGQVVGVLFQLLRIIFDVICIGHVLGNALTNVDQQRAGTAGRVVNLDFRSAAQMVGDDFRHQQRNLMRRIEFARLFSCVGSKHTDEVFIDEPKHIIALTAVHGDVLNEIEQSADRLGLRAGAVAKFGKPGFQGVENFFEYALVRRRNQPAECRERIADVGNIKILAHAKPSREKILIGDKVADILLYPLDGFCLVFGHRFKQFIIVIIRLQKFNFLIGQVFIENEAENKVLVFAGFNLGSHLICRSPYFLCKLLFVHGAQSFLFFRLKIEVLCY